MLISELCIKRPVLAIVMNIMLVLVGVIAFDRLTVREYPKIDEPVVTVDTTYPGASAEIIESQITEVLENSLAGIEGIEVLTSISRQENSQISLRFKINRDVEGAAGDVRDRVARVRNLLPLEVKEPVIAKVEADAQPILYLAFYSDRHSAMEVTDFADRFVKDRIQNLPGVADVRIFGERRLSMRLWLNPEKLALYGLTPADVETALRHQNVEIPAGILESQQREFSIVSQSALETPEQFNKLVIKRDGDKLVYFESVGRAEYAPADVRRTTRFNGREAVALGVVKQATANPLGVSQSVRDIMPVIQASLPEGILLDMAYDTSVFIDRSIKAVFTTILEAIGLVVLVIFFFLRSPRSTMIPLMTIPVSLIGTFMMMYYLNFSINTLTLLALVLAIGLVVDDAIVMLENIYRHIEEGMPPKEAAIQGSKEITFAVVAMTLTLAAVYAPVAFMEGRTGKLFTEFALTLAGAVIISGFIALTLSPMMCSRLKHEKNHGRFYLKIEGVLNGISSAYDSGLDRAFRFKKTVISAGLVIASLGAVFALLLPSELAPIEDRGTVVVIGIAPEGSTIDYTSAWMQKLEPIFQSVPEVEKYFVIAGFPLVSQGIAFTRLADWEDRHRSQQSIVTQWMPQIFGGIPGIMAFPINPPSLGRSPVSKPIEFVIQTSDSYEALDKAVNRFMEVASKHPGLVSLDSDLKLNKPQINVSIDRNKAAALGVEIDEIGRALETMMGGRQVTRFKHLSDQYDVIVKIEDDRRQNPSDISNVYVRGQKNSLIPLSNLVTMEETVAPRELNHFNKLRAVTITGDVQGSLSLSEALQYLKDLAKKELPPLMQIDYNGESREFLESSSTLLVTMILALCFIFLVLAAQFESFISPLVIIMTVPLSMSGALGLLYFAGGTLNIYSQIGLITLIGLITKHGILIVEFSNQLIEQGRRLDNAIKEACALRLRPILMTTGAMVLGALPLMMAQGAGAESRHQIGWVIVGGMLVGTLFTLFVIPVVYSLVHSEHKES